jgi:hypothetical protein
MKYLLAWVAFFSLCLTASAQTIGAGVTIGQGVTIGVATGGSGVITPPPPTGGLTFSPAAGSYTGTQNVTISYSPGGAGQSIFYTTNGSIVSEASTLYTGPIPLSSTSNLQVLVEQAGTVRQEMQSLTTGWKLCAPIYFNNPVCPPVGSTGTVHCAYQNGTPNATCGGGVGSAQPSAWNVTFGATETMSITSNASGFPQILVTNGGSGCDGCTKITMDKWIKPLDADTHIQNHELDAWHNIKSANRLHMIGFQCNQQSGNPAVGGGIKGKQWQVDNEQGNSNKYNTSWTNLNVTDSCPLSTILWTHVIVHAHWINGDDGCGDRINASSKGGNNPAVHGGKGCTYYDDMSVGTAASPTSPITMHKYLINLTLENDDPGWASGCTDQDQLDMLNGGTASVPISGGLLIQHNNVTCSNQTVSTGSAAYTIH